MNHKTHIFMMVGLIVAAIALFSTGYGASWVLFALLGACAVMMMFMMRGMGGMSGGRDRDGMDGRRSEGSADATPHTADHEHH